MEALVLQWLPIFIALVFTGAVAGILAGLLGVGGGIVIVPVLYFIFQLLGVSAASAMSIAAGTSLLTIIPTSISSIRAHHKRANIDLAIVKVWAVFIVAGAVLGSFLSISFSGTLASTIFGIVAVLVALNMLFRASSTALLPSLPRAYWQAPIAAVVGTFSVIMGIGGGTLGVPLLTAFNVPAHRAVGTAAVFGFFIALPGALLMLLFASALPDAPPGTYGYVNLYGFLVIVPMTTLLAPLGVKLGAFLDGAKLKRVFAVFLLFSASRMIYQSLF